jgi:hypothetical protein
MKPGYKSLTGWLAILGIGDLAIVPSMIAANHHIAGKPPVPAIVATIIIGVATLVSAAGIARGWKQAFAGSDDMPDRRQHLLGAWPRRAMRGALAGSLVLLGACSTASGGGVTSSSSPSAAHGSAVVVGVNPQASALDPLTHTLYVESDPENGTPPP